MSHTPGPWEAIGAGISSSAMTVPNASGRMIDFRVALCKDGDVDTVRANARLIAVAPELYELARAVAEHFADTDAPLGERARALIAKAEP